jgi:dATP pyrophosphohydrolase
MARAPFNVLVIPYRHVEGVAEFAVFHRAGSDMWQFIAGGGEDDEDPSDTARRETREEAGIVVSDESWTRLDSVASVPRTAFPNAPWPESVDVIPQYSFAFDATDVELRLSVEHDGLEWLTFEEAVERLTWDSNRVALWELRERMLRAI